MRRALIPLAVLAVACSKEDPPRAAPSAPWPAREPAPRALDSRRIGYTLEPRGEARFELPAREATARGATRVARGHLTVDVLNLTRTRGSVDIDLGSLVMQGDADASADEATNRAHDWLEVGASRPESLRERMRWARFTLVRIEQASAEAAHAGKPVETDAGQSPGADARDVDLIVGGELELHGHRVEQTAALRVTFVYAAAASAERDPERIVVRTRRPIAVSLRTHDIQPRDAHGALVAAELGWLGTRVGREARVELELALVKAR